MSKKKKIEAAVRQLEREITQDGIVVTFEEMANAVKDFGNAITMPLIPSPVSLRYTVPKEDNTPKEFHPLLCTRCGGGIGRRKLACHVLDRGRGQPI